MKIRLAGILAGLCPLAACWGQLSILSFDREGHLTWTNCTETATYRIEWTSALDSGGASFQTLANFESIVATGSLMSVQLPMPTERSVFYRVVWVDAPRPNGMFYYVAYDPLFGPELTCATGTVNLSDAGGVISASWEFEEGDLICEHPVGTGSGPGYFDGCYLLLGQSPFWLSGLFDGDLYAGVWTYVDLAGAYSGEFVAMKMALLAPSAR